MIEDVAALIGPVEEREVLRGAPTNDIRVFARPDGTEMVAKRSDPQLISAEVARLQWLQGRARTPRLLAHTPTIVVCERLPGNDLGRAAHTIGSKKTIGLLLQALELLGQLPACPWGSGARVVHADACLPNFLTDGERITGIIDVATLRMGTMDDDLAGMLWSLGTSGFPHARPMLMDAVGCERNRIGELSHRFAHPAEELLSS